MPKFYELPRNTRFKCNLPDDEVGEIPISGLFLRMDGVYARIIWDSYPEEVINIHGSVEVEIIK